MDKYKQVIKSNPLFMQKYDDVQSFLFCGNDPLGLLYFARFFIERECQKINSADIIELPASEKVLVEDIDFLTKTALLTPIELPQKYYIIRCAETMNDSAANKLLKTLEEPPNKVKIILLAKDERSVLATIRSRCAILTLPPFNDDLLIEIIDKHYVDSHHAYLAKELAMGSITRLELAVNGEYSLLIQLVFDTLMFMKSSPQILQFCQQIISYKDRISDIIDLIELTLNDCMRLRNGLEIVLKHRRADLIKITEFYNDDVIIRLKAVFMRAKRRNELSNNPNSIIDQLLFSMLETRKKFTLE